jgi:hypothetical protein
MSKENKNIEEVDAYLSGEITGEELEAFEIRLRLEGQLKADLDATKKVIEGVEGYAFKKTLTEIHNNYTQEKKRERKKLFYLPAIAASIVLFILVSIFIKYDNSHYAYFKPYPGVVVVRSGGNTSISKALQLYDMEAYEEALREFEKIPPAAYTEEIQFFHALSYLGDKNPEKAQKILETIRTVQYHEQIKWYLALCYALTNNNQQAKEKLEQIKPGEFEYDNAQMLLKELK